ncbi:Asp domain-containing protein [Cephalotus follicularis]|uniref:Asp domain-containing protein n=1 Tax=Cephalotus follicularis TaxID=3775 RepID=A0A1Q3BU25_CEPFO|nr:Asp domain-containing protein [Cephalotus follicularis]
MMGAGPLLPLKLSLVILFLFSVAASVQCFEKKVLNLQNLQWKQKNGISNFLPQKSRREKGATMLEIKHRHYSGKTIDWNKKLQKSLILDDIHVRSLQSRIKNMVYGTVKDISSQTPLTSGARLQTLNYIVAVSLGGQQMTMIVDTGSDLTWVQCQPCTSCYNQQDPLYTPSISPSFQAVLCNSSTCQSVQSATGTSGLCGSNSPSCNYIVSYGDGSYTRGDLGSEELNLGTTTVKSFIFGCGRNNKGLFGGASGLMGLGRSPLSLVSQTSAIFDGVFSYCLPSTGAGDSGSLVLGANPFLYKNTTPITYTRMLPNLQVPTFYFLNLTGVSVGGVPLQAESFGKGGILIDSGTVISRLPPSIYKALQTEFVKQFSGFPSAPAFSILDTCYNLTAYQEVNIPTITMYFEGNAEIDVDVLGMFYFVKSDASQMCLALASLSSKDDMGIIGNYQQRNQRVIYDTKESKLGFASETCNFNEA